MNILITGPNWSGKTTLALSLARMLDATYISERDIRTEFSDWDSTPAGTWRLGVRFHLLSSEREVMIFESIVIPTNYKPDKIIFMNTVENSMDIPRGALVISSNEWWRDPWIGYWSRLIAGEVCKS